MPIDYVVGDATKPYGLGPKVICHSVNDVGQWGAGFVLALAQWPHVEDHYRQWHQTGSTSLVVALPPNASEGHSDFKLGSVQFVEVERELWIANIVGQHRTARDEGIPVRYDALEAGFRSVLAFCKVHSASAHMPRIGAGLGRGKWNIICRTIEKTLASRGVSVTVYDLPGQKRPA